MKISCPQYQQGAAMIMFMLMLPVLVGFMFLTVDTGRFLRLKAQVADASEVASLAVSAYPMGADGWNNAERETREELAKNYITSLVPDLGGNPDTDRLLVIVDYKGYEECTDCDPLKTYAQFTLDVTTKHDAIFPAKTEDDFGFASQVTFGSQSISRKYNGSPVDLVLVADFSGSMNYSWVDENGYTVAKTKVGMLKDVVKQTVEKIETYSDGVDMRNTISLVPFNTYTNDRKPIRATLQAKIEWQEYRCDDNRDDDDCYYTVKTPWKGQANSWKLPNNFSIQTANTINDLFEDKEELENAKPPQYNENFYTLELPSSYDEITKAVGKFKAAGATASYEGIIRGARIAKKGNNPRRLIVVLSDGKDQGVTYKDSKKLSNYKPNLFHEELLAAEPDYCEKIRSELNSQTTDTGLQVESKIAVIGFDYDIDTNPNLKKCAGEENVYEASNPEALNAILQGLIDEEIGHLYSPSDS